uniref:Receptor activity modifying protein 1 n=1 Tax=Aquila chrysaetos chrysaetos TaxID=223781 RepID=A0A663DNN7_AQUCH
MGSAAGGGGVRTPGGRGPALTCRPALLPSWLSSPSTHRPQWAPCGLCRGSQEPRSRELSSCTQLLAQLLSCPWPSAILDTFFLQVHAEYFTNCTGARPPRLGGLPPRMAVAVAVGLSCLVPLAAALTLTRARKGAQTPVGSCPAPACLCACEGLATAPFPPSPGN